MMLYSGFATSVVDTVITLLRERLVVVVVVGLVVKRGTPNPKNPVVSL